MKSKVQFHQLCIFIHPLKLIRISITNFTICYLHIKAVIKKSFFNILILILPQRDDQRQTRYASRLHFWISSLGHHRVRLGIENCLAFERIQKGWFWFIAWKALKFLCCILQGKSFPLISLQTIQLSVI